MNRDFGWDEAVKELRPVVDAMHRARESTLTLCRQLTQVSSRCIRHIHRRQIPEAEELLAEARAISARAREGLVNHPQIQFAGYLQDAEKEMVEAHAVYAVVTKKRLPSCRELGVDPAAYLNGMGEAASECRRYVLDELRRSRQEEAERMLAEMEIIYDDLISFDYPDSLTGGLRRTCDALRAVIERSRSDLTLTMGQARLIEELQKTRDAMTTEILI